MPKVAAARPDLIPLFKDAEVSHSVSTGSGKKVELVCRRCGFELSRRVADLVKRGFHCPVCYGGYSYPSRVVASVLRNLNVDFKTEVIFQWAGKYRYAGLNWRRFRSPTPAMYSDQAYLKNQIINSGSFQVLQTDTRNLDWGNVFEMADDGIAKQVLCMWDSGMSSTSKISKHLNIDTSTVRSYLKTYAELGRCDYDPKESQKRGGIAAKSKRMKRTMCVETGEVFESAREAARAYGLKENALYECLRGKNSSSGKDSFGNKLHWKYL